MARSFHYTLCATGLSVVALFTTAAAQNLTRNDTIQQVIDVINQRNQARVAGDKTQLALMQGTVLSEIRANADNILTFCSTQGPAALGMPVCTEISDAIASRNAYAPR